MNKNKKSVGHEDEKVAPTQIAHIVGWNIY